MKFFSKEEILVLSAILLVLIIVSVPNFIVSVRRSRDAQRKNDIGVLADGLGNFANNFGSYPLSSPDGKILACNPKISYVAKIVKVDFDPCEWGKDDLRDALDTSYPPYITALPFDPKHNEGVSYLYLSNGKRFQIFAHLEGTDEAEYDPKIAARNLLCGNKVCNFGRAPGATPLNKSIEEYENELLDKTPTLP